MAMKVGELQAEVGIDDGQFTRGLADAERRFRKSAEDMERRKITPEVDGSKADSGMANMMGTLKTAALAGAALVGAAAGAALMSSLTGSMERSKERANLQASMGLTEDQAKAMGKMAGELYAEAYGESTKDTMAGIQATLSMGGLGEMDTDTFKSLTKQAMSLAQVLGSDVSAVTRSASNLMRNGLAKNAQEAFDLIAAGQQQGANGAGDLLDTIDEYSVKFKQLGLTGPQMMNMLIAGMKAGARDTDFLADAYKELQISATDGSVATAEAIGQLNLDSDVIRRKLLEGGPAAAEASSQIIAALGAIEDPVKRNEIGLALFKTKWEDVGPAALGAMGQANQGLTDFEGKAAQVDSTLSNTSAGWFETMKRQFLQPVNDFLDEHLTADNLSSGLAGATAMFGLAWGLMKSSVLDPTIGVLQTIGDTAGGVLDTFENWVQVGWDLIKNGIQGIADGLTWVVDHVLDPVIGTLQRLWDMLPEPVKRGLASLGGMSVPGFDDGGVVPGPPGSDQMVLAHGGETILPTHRMPLGQAVAQVTNTTNRGFTANITTYGQDPQRSAMANRRAMQSAAFMAGAT